MFSDYITLIGKTYETDETAELVEIITERDVYAKVLSVGQQEFYQAMANGLKPEIKFELSDYLEYENEKELIYNGYKYQILRTYRKGQRALELTCYGGVNLGNA